MVHWNPSPVIPSGHVQVRLVGEALAQRAATLQPPLLHAQVQEKLPGFALLVHVAFAWHK
jgi:hypothetical protein